MEILGATKREKDEIEGIEELRIWEYIFFLPDAVFIITEKAS